MTIQWHTVAQNNLVALMFPLLLLLVLLLSGSFCRWTSTLKKGDAAGTAERRGLHLIAAETEAAAIFSSAWWGGPRIQLSIAMLGATGTKVPESGSQNPNKTPPDAQFSRHRCIGPGNSVDGYPTRICRFENLCFIEGQFRYFTRLPIPIIFDKRLGVQYNFSVAGKPFVSMWAVDHEGAPFTPVAVEGKIPDDAIMYDDPVFVWRHWSVDGNIGHVLWEELGTVYYTQRRFSDFSPKTQVIHIGGLPASYTRLVDVILPAISNKPMRTLSNVVGDRPAVCFPKLFVGGAVPLFRLPKEPLLEGREELLMGFRNAVVESVRVVPALPRVPTILITHKTYSMWAKHTPWHRVIHNAAELRQFIAEAFPEAAVELVEWHHLPFAQQLQKLGHTSVLITPCGGVSMILPFLPDGAHAIVMDYLSTGSRDDPWGYQAGESASMEITLWNRFPHVTKYYYQVFNHSDLVFDYNGTRDTRNDASIRVDFRRMHRLLLSALSTMGYTVTPHDS